MIITENTKIVEHFLPRAIDDQDTLKLEQMSDKLTAKSIRHILIADKLEDIVCYTVMDLNFLIKAISVLQKYIPALFCCVQAPVHKAEIK